MSKIWFKTTKNRIFWYPCSKEGWLTTLVYFTLLVITGSIIDKSSHSISDTLIGWFPYILILTLILLIVKHQKS